MAYWKITITGTLSDTIMLDADSKKQAIEDALDAFEAFYELRRTESNTPEVWDRLDIVRVKKDR